MKKIEDENKNEGRDYPYPEGLYKRKRGNSKSANQWLSEPTVFIRVNYTQTSCSTLITLKI